MSAEIFLMTPATEDPSALAAQLGQILDKTSIAAVFVPKRGLDDARYSLLARTLLPVAQAADCALLLDNEPVLARSLGADGVHVPSDPAIIKAAIDALKPDMIVGAGPFSSRHAVMTAGELGIDYVLFGALGLEDGQKTSQSAADDAYEQAHWWAETFEVPAVLFEPADEQLSRIATEFVGFGPTLWQNGADPLKTLAAKRERMSGGAG